MANESLKSGLKTEIELALRGEGAGGGVPEPSAVWLLKERSLPRALVTDARGVVTPKVVDYVDLLSMLDASCVVSELRKPPVRRVPLPTLPEGALFVDMIERSSGSSYVVTGVAAPREHPFVTDGAAGPTTHDLLLPHLAYRVLWHEAEGTLEDLCLALCSPDLEGPPTARTEIYRFPFAHVYDHDARYGQPARYQRVCWNGLGSVRCALADVVPAGVEAFLSSPNDAVGHAAHISPYAPTRDYVGFLAAVERNRGLEHDWLEPCAMTIEDLHHQRRRHS